MPKKILFVEDEHALQRTLKDTFEDAGYDFVQAYNGEEGLSVAQEEMPDLILLDLILPKKDGFEVLQELKEDSDTQNIPVIVLTNLEGAGDVQRALDAGAKTYLVKANYKLDDVLSKVEETLEENIG